MNTPYSKQLQTNSEGKQIVINEITKSNPYLSLTKIPGKTPKEDIIIPSRSNRRKYKKYAANGQKSHGNNRASTSERKNSRTNKRF